MKRKSQAHKFLAILAVVVLVVSGMVGLADGAHRLPLMDKWGYGLIGAVIVMILTPAIRTSTVTRAYQDRQVFLNGVDRVMAGRGWRRKTVAGDLVMYHPLSFVAPFMDGLAVDVSAPGMATLTGPNQFLNLLKNIP